MGIFLRKMSKFNLDAMNETSGADVHRTSRTEGKPLPDLPHGGGGEQSGISNPPCMADAKKGNAERGRRGGGG